MSRAKKTKDIASSDTSHVFIVFPTFNNNRDANRLVEQLLGQDFEGFSIIAVDHGGKKTDFAKVKKERLEVIRASSELWWSGAINLGIRRVIAKSEANDYILVINDDVEIALNYLSKIVGEAKRYTGSLIGSVCIDNVTDKVRYADMRLDRLRATFSSKYADRNVEDLPKNTPLTCDVLSGRGVLIPSEVFKDIGLFDEDRLPHYSSDYEFTWRARQRGYRLICPTNIKVKTGPKIGPDANRKRLFSYLMEKKTRGNIPTTVAFSSSCFSPGYAAYYTTTVTLKLCARYFVDRILKNRG